MTADNHASMHGSDGLAQRTYALAREASALWTLAVDHARWGFVQEAAELRRLAISKRVQHLLASSTIGA
ncbi:hypothetical protein [Aureimonas leprariae]|uniref:hypothetical protein n=1 Tax=Plantimonas leprariae TaxID=2615207 RepID=UPI001386F8E6|nr:hypothetical protein [Aureimonas leprariae]